MDSTTIKIMAKKFEEQNTEKSVIAQAQFKNKLFTEISGMPLQEKIKLMKSCREDFGSTNGIYKDVRDCVLWDYMDSMVEKRMRFNQMTTTSDTVKKSETDLKTFIENLKPDQRIMFDYIASHYDAPVPDTDPARPEYLKVFNDVKAEIDKAVIDIKANKNRTEDTIDDLNKNNSQAIEEKYTEITNNLEENAGNTPTNEPQPMYHDTYASDAMEDAAEQKSNEEYSTEPTEPEQTEPDSDEMDNDVMTMMKGLGNF